MASSLWSGPFSPPARFFCPWFLKKAMPTPNRSSRAISIIWPTLSPSSNFSLLLSGATAPRKSVPPTTSPFSLVRSISFSFWSPPRPLPTALFSAGYIFYKLAPGKILPLAISLITLLFMTNVSFFRPREWFDLTIWEKFSGYSWDRQLTISIFDYLPVSAKFPPAFAAPLLPYGAKTKISILDFTRSSDTLRFTTKSLTADVLILPQFDFPGWQVKLDGKKVSHRRAFDLGLIALDLPAGEHRLEASLKKTLPRFVGDLATLIFAPLALYTLISKKPHGQK